MPVISLLMPGGLEICETGSKKLIPDFSSQFWFQLEAFFGST